MLYCKSFYSFIGNEARVVLKDVSDQSTSNYINAAFIDVRFTACCFRKVKKFLCSRNNVDIT